MKTLIDTMNIVFMAYHMARKQLHDREETLTDDTIGFFAHMFFNKVNALVSTYENVIFCWEGRGSLDYRRSVYPDYKGNRKAQKDEDEYKALSRFFPAMEEALTHYPIKHIRVNGGEADDAIYALCEKHQNEDIVVLSSDGDLTQLTNFFPKVFVFNPIFKKAAKISPTIIQQKAACGDASDNIPGLYRIGPKTFEKMLNDKNEWNKVMNKENNKALYEIFLSIIDLSKYPKDYHDKVKQLDEDEEFCKFSPDWLERFFWDYKMKDMLSRWENKKSDIYLHLGVQETNKKIEELSETKIDNSEPDELDKIIADFV